MARRKDAKDTNSASARSLAAIFNDLSAAELSPAPAENAKAGQSAKPADALDESEEAELPATFPLNLIYDFQDLLNEKLTVSKGVQLLVIAYLTQIFYIHFSKDGTDLVSAVGFNMLSAIFAMYLSHRSLLKKHLANPDTTLYPELPSFNTVWGFFLPYSFVLLLGDPKDSFFQVNLSLTTFGLKNLHPIAKVLSAFVYNYMFTDIETLDVFKFGQVVWVYFTVDYALTLWNEEVVTDEHETVEVRRTLDQTEIHLVGIFLVNLFSNFNVPTTEHNVPIVVVKILFVALIGAFAASYPVIYIRSTLQQGALRSVVSGGVVATFSAAFYYATNYLFQNLVVKQEVILWLIEFITASELRVQLITGWATALVALVPVVFFLASKDYLSLNIRRKVWHFALAGALAYPALVQEPTFSAIAVFGAVFVFIVVEAARYTELTFIGAFLKKQLSLFQDKKDSQGPLNLSYIFLLVGVAIPIGYGILVDDVVSIRSYIGLVALGLGDSFASIVGKKFGKFNWKGESRTLEGTITYIVVSFVGFLFVDYYLLPEGARVTNWENILIVSLVGGAIEGSASLNDNVLLPSVKLITYELLNKAF